MMTLKSLDIEWAPDRLDSVTQNTKDPVPLCLFVLGHLHYQIPPCGTPLKVFWLGDDGLGEINFSLNFS